MDRRGQLMFDRLAGLPLDIESYDYVRLTGGERSTTLLRLHGRGHRGLGEDIMPAVEDHDALEAQTEFPLVGSWTLVEFLDALGSFDQWGGVEPEFADFARPFRNWLFESAALDLALLQAGLSLGDALGRTARPVTFVNSFGLGETPSVDGVRARLELYPSVGFKLDAAPAWSRGLIEELAGTGAVRTVDFKGRYGLEVEGDFAPVYEAVLELLPEARIEDPHEAFAAGLPLERVAYDAPIKRASDIGATQTINVKPSRIGDLRSLLEIYAHCEAHGVVMYGGGMGELGPAREQVQLLAALFHPDGPNDVAPPPFNLPEPISGLPTSPLEVTAPPIGFRLK
ncbi:hypothetical protein OJ997_07515 [Solirubrobacter phytolaccae]|uniref:Enolase C-terminal domain-containing protein n=1 Tax=Solirubrobacter phytolaccae TaxID=1404360 RepID=A0A9X3S7D3_9ACTN|nr:hypothetical protein [Solirubrobacter phytolaccae]MDA0180138.1 hypothetical protein [Solirubrobacter phytolaccae]